MVVNKSSARKYLIKYHHLNDNKLKSKEEILNYIKKVGSIQFDPLNIVTSNHELVLNSRVKSFNRNTLKQLLYNDRKLVDGWDKNMCIYSSEDYPYFKYVREYIYENSTKRVGEHSELKEKILCEIRNRGPLSSLDIDDNERINLWGWSNSKLSRIIMEDMHLYGELTVFERINSRKVYDIFSNHHVFNELEDYTWEDYVDFHVARRIGAVGFLWDKRSDAFLGDGRIKTEDRKKSLKRLLDSEKIKKFTIEGIKEDFYIKSENFMDLEKEFESDDLKENINIIAPLDNLLWDRKLIAELFNFEYVWEVYKPKELRKYGYYVLPILCGDKFVGRFEPEVNRSEKKLIVKNFWWEQGIKPTVKLRKKVCNKLIDFSKYLDLKDVEMEILKGS